MIHFRCMYCDWPVCVADSCAGQKGACPSCKAVITIPAADAGHFSAQPSVSPTDTQEGADDFAELETANLDPGGETDILPADTAQVRTGTFRIRRRRTRDEKKPISAPKPAGRVLLARRVRLFVLTFLITLLCIVAALAMRRWILN